MKKLIISVLYCFSFVFIYGNAIDNNGIIPRGQVIDTIKCIDNRQQTYAAYLPSYYSTDNRYPVVYIFEPAARGVLPVKKYRHLAEEFGLILVCSNNSRNGAQEPIDLAYWSVFVDTKTRFTEDTSRFYTMGFSGGARVATRIAIRDKNIKGVIACGAGFPHEYKPGYGMNFSFVGLIGDLDMNYYEMKGLEAELENKNIRHSMLYYHDDHSWPPEDEMRKAFLFLHFDAMRRSLIKKDVKKIEEYKLLKTNELRLIKDTCDLYNAYNMLYSNLVDLTETGEIEEKLKELERDEKVKFCINEERNYLKKETVLAQSFSEAFYNPEKYGLQWWKSETAKLNKTIKDSLDQRMTFIAKRMVNKIYLMVFENYWLNNQDFSTEGSVRILKIASLAKPESPYPDYYLAGIYAKNKKEGQAIKMLQKSIGKGFSNLTYLQADKSFDNIRTNKKYLELESSLQVH